MWKDVVNLITVATIQDADGYPVAVETPKEVFVNIKSATRSEFYAALQAGITVSKVFEVRVCDYADEKLIEYASKKYNVIRTFTQDGEILQLNCSDLAV